MDQLISKLTQAEGRAVAAKNYKHAGEIKQAIESLHNKLKQCEELAAQETTLAQAKDYSGAAAAASRLSMERDTLAAEEARVEQAFASELVTPSATAVTMGRPSLATPTVASMQPVAVPVAPAVATASIIAVHNLEAQDAPPGAPSGGVWQEEKYFGPKLFWIGFCCLGPLFTACAYHTCDCDKRAVYVAPNGVRYPRQKSQLRRFIAVETVWIILLVVLIILNASGDDDDDGYTYG